LLRSGARAGDDLWASGNFGDARVALEVFRGNLSLPADAFASVRDRMELPQPRVALGQALRGIATSAIDVSDGMAGDLRHVLAASGAGASVDAQAAVSLLACAAHIDAAQQLDFVVAGGDDYELLFTAPAGAREAVERAGVVAKTRVTRIGRIEAARGMRVADANGRLLEREFGTFDHFA
jgi:thiamine-monophosphate kinase